MTKEDFISFLEDDCGQEHGEFERIPKEERLASRPDVHLMILLDRLLPDTNEFPLCLTSHANEDGVFLETKVEDLVKVITDEQALQLLRCGLAYDKESHYLFFFTDQPEYRES